ncbi:hypothetical protein SAMN04488694_11762, partial [Natrinema hispanicum]
RTVLRRRPVRPRNEAISEKAVGERTFQKSVSVLTVQSEYHDTSDSADTCRRPAGKNNTGTPNTVEDRGNGGLAPPPVHQFDVWGYPCPKGLVVR